jgi:hypothetical protein
MIAMGNAAYVNTFFGDLSWSASFMSFLFIQSIAIAIATIVAAYTSAKQLPAVIHASTTS